jgi:hypothetical protein
MCTCTVIPLTHAIHVCLRVTSVDYISLAIHMCACRVCSLYHISDRSCYRWRSHCLNGLIKAGFIRRSPHDALLWRTLCYPSDFIATNLKHAIAITLDVFDLPRLQEDCSKRLFWCPPDDRHHTASAFRISLFCWLSFRGTSLKLLTNHIACHEAR